MLSSMRKSAGSWMIKILLGIIVLAFIFMGAGSFYSRRGATVAKVNGEPVTVDEYQQAYNRIMQNLRQQFGDRLDDKMLETLDVKNQAINWLVEKHLLMQVAENNDMRVPNEVLARSIAQLPVFQSNGRFDPQLYRQVLNQNRLSPEGFETMQKEAMLTAMIRNLVANAIPVSEAEARAWYNWKNTEIQIDYAAFSAGGFDDVEITEEEVRRYFAANQKNYQTEPKIRARYLRFAPEDHLDQVRVTDAEIRGYYESHASEFTVPETVTARHILLRVPEDADEKTVAETREKALEIMEKARSGRDFAELARNFSEGPTAKDGGYLGSFERGDMVKPFSDKAFSMQAGQISEPVRTRFGWHIIKVEEHKPSEKKPLEAVEEKIREKLAMQKAKNLAYDKAWSVYEVSFEGEDLVANARDMSLDLQTTDFFTQSRGPENLENAGAFAKAAFGLPLMEISGVKEIGGAYFLIQPVEKKDPEIPDLQSIFEQVRSDALREKRKEMAKKAAEEFLRQVRSEKSFEQAARSARIEIQTTDFFRRNQPVPGIGRNPRLSEAAFSLTAENPVSDSVIAAGDTFYAIRLRNQKAPAESDFEAEKEAVIRQLENRKRQQALNKWIASLRQNSVIQVSKRFSN